MTLKEIKQSARVKLKGSYLLCASATLLYFIITLALTYLLQFITNNLPTHQFTAMIIEAIFFIISFALAFGITINTVNIADGKTKNISKFIDNSILNFTKFTKILFYYTFID